MKKLSFIPKRDTITICLPPDWVGKKITCFLSSVAEEDTKEKKILMAAERPVKYNAKTKTKTKTKAKTNKAKSTQKSKAKKTQSSPIKNGKKNSVKSVKVNMEKVETEMTNEVQLQSNA